MKIAKDRVVSIDYTLHDEAGKLLDSNDKAELLAYIQGEGHIVPGLEEALDGRAPGDTVQVTVAPDKGYGPRDESLVFDLSRDKFREAGVDKPETGMQFEVEGEGHTHLITITKVGEQDVTVDANHPLAGMTLRFDVKVVDVRLATPEELEHGHVHDSHHDHEDA